MLVLIKTCNKYLIISLVLCFSFLSLISNNQIVYAKDSLTSKGLTLSPLRNEFDIAPGTAHDGSLKVTNSTEKTMKVNLTAEEFSVINPQYDYAFSQESDVTKWVKFESTEIDLSAGETKNFKYIIGVPLSAEPGGRYLSLFATTNTQSQTDTSVNSQQRVASLLYITVSGEATRVGKLVSLTSPTMVSGKTSWSVLLQNAGTTHYRSRYNVQIVNLFSNEIEASSQGASLVLPDSLRLIDNNLPLPKLPGIYKAVYTIGLGDTPAKVETRYIVYVTPLSVFIAVFLILALYFLISFRHNKKLKKKVN